MLDDVNNIFASEEELRAYFYAEFESADTSEYPDYYETFVPLTYPEGITDEDSLEEAYDEYIAEVQPLNDIARFDIWL